MKPRWEKWYEWRMSILLWNYYDMKCVIIIMNEKMILWREWYEMETIIIIMKIEERLIITCEGRLVKEEILCGYYCNVINYYEYCEGNWMEGEIWYEVILESEICRYGRH